MKKNPQKRLGRGLDSLISGGVKKDVPQVPPPSVQIDKTIIEAKNSSPLPTLKTPLQGSSALPHSVSGNPAAPQKNDLVEDLNELLKKTQKEMAEAHDSFSDEERTAEDEKLRGAQAPKVSRPAFAHLPKAQNSSGASAEGSFALLNAEAIVSSPFQRRKEFSASEIQELAESIRSEGLLQPIVVRALEAGSYELIAGERRLRACRHIGMTLIPARIVSVEDASAAVMGLIENLQRVDLNPVEEARGYGMLLTDFHMTQEEISQRVGKARSTVANSLRLALLENEILGYLAKGQLSTGHAKLLLGLPEGPERVLLARQVIEGALSVRETESLMRRAGREGGPKQKTKRLASAEEVASLRELEARMVSRLNAKVKIAHGGKGGRVVVYYKNNAELDGILKRMGM